MPASSAPPSTVCVLDTNIIIAFKTRLKRIEQWETLQWLGLLVADGWLTFPKQVATELEKAQYFDGPGLWAVGNRPLRCYPEVTDDMMAEVLGIAPGLFDPNEERNQADPYVVALAYELRERYDSCRVVVATENTKDQPPLISPGTACGLLGLERVDWDGFMEWCTDVAIARGESR